MSAIDLTFFFFKEHFRFFGFHTAQFNYIQLNIEGGVHTFRFNNSPFFKLKSNSHISKPLSTPFVGILKLRRTVIGAITNNNYSHFHN